MSVTIYDGDAGERGQAMTAISRERIEEIAASISSGFEPEPPIVEALERVAAEVEERLRAEAAMLRAESVERETAELQAKAGEWDKRWREDCAAAMNAERERDELKRRLAEAEEAIRWYDGQGTKDQPRFPDASVVPRYRFRTTARETFPAVRRALGEEEP